MDRKDAETKGRHIKEANKEKKSVGASTSSASHQGGSSGNVALASHLESISSVVGSNNKINGSGGSGGLLTQASVASGGPLTQEN
ncbi:hypothetical protein SO802_004988, partial [Lithocarpus litseifolius]